MKTPLPILCGLLMSSSLLAAYSIDGVIAELSIQITGKIILVPAEVDGVRGHLLLDTGAPELILNEQYFPAAGTGTSKMLHHIGRQVSCESMWVQHFMMGDIYRNDFTAVIADLRTTEKTMGRPILGLLGYDLLRHFETRIDYYAGFIAFCALDDDGNPLTQWRRESADHELAFLLEGHIPAIHGGLYGREKVVFGLDSGAEVNLMDQSYRNFLRRNCLSERKIDIQCINAKVEKAPFFVMGSMEVTDHYQIRYWRTSVGDFSHLRQHGIQIQGILGANFFQLGRIALNYRKQSIQIWEAPNRKNHRYICLGH